MAPSADPRPPDRETMNADLATAARAAPVIDLRDLEKVYHAGEVDVRAVAGLTLRVARGEFVAVMGASGSGKSTLMNILGCLDRPTAGSYLLDGVNVATLNRKQLAQLRNRKLGFVFQSFNLLARTTAMENVELPLFYSEPLVSIRERHRRSREALEKVGLGNRLTHRPSQLSGGQQQRIAIARALVNKPDLLLADEPTGNLDTKNSDTVLAMLRQLNEEFGQTIVMITHNPDAAASGDSVVHMRDGVIVDGVPPN
jgi:putative ABC transport system ATP-binding protein